MMAIAVIGEAARCIATALHDPPGDRVGLPDHLRPDNLARAYAIQQAVCLRMHALWQRQ